MNDIIYLSVVLSTYNEEKYIRDSIESVLNQTYPHFELIVVNDGSNDSTSEILSSISDPRIRILEKENSGLPDSLNQGIKMAKYDWIARMDGDDIAEPTRFEKQVAALDDKVGVVGGQFRVIDSEGRLKSKSISNKPLTSYGCKKSILLGMSPFAHPSVIIRKELLEKWGGYDANFTAAQDLELWSRLSPNAILKNIPEPVLKYRKHDGAITNKRYGLQMKLTFLGFLKYVLKIRRPLTNVEFQRFESYFEKNGLVRKNTQLFEKSHTGKGIVRNLKIGFYYIWRILILVKYRMIGGSVKRFIFSV